MKHLMTLLLLLVASVAMAQDVIVLKDGSILNVYNLEESETSYFYTMSPAEGATTLKINKSDVFSVKKGEVTTITQAPATAAAPATPATPEYQPVTAQYSRDIEVRRNSNHCFSAITPDGHELNYQVISEADRRVSVIKGTYHAREYVIPDYVKMGDKTYTVTEVDEEAFLRENTVRLVRFPRTLKKIGESAFTFANLERIDLPDGLEELGPKAFAGTGFRETSPVIYVPSTVVKMGKECFRSCGRNLSYRGYCQEYFSNLPSFITEDNCTDYGIDEEAVEAFYRRKALNMNQR